MISDQIIKSDFIVSVLERDVLNVFKAQRLIAQHNVYVEGRNLKQKRGKGSSIGQRSGALMASLSNPDYSISSSGSFLVVANIVKHMRFLDMKKRGNRKIYNRQVWGILYNNTLPEIKYSFGSSTRDLLGEELQRAFDKYEKG